jgi:hypothetical protein
MRFLSNLALYPIWYVGALVSVPSFPHGAELFGMAAELGLTEIAVL